MSALRIRRRGPANKQNAKIGHFLPWEDHEKFLRLREVLSRALVHENSGISSLPSAALATLGNSAVQLFPERCCEDKVEYPGCFHSCINLSGSPSHVLHSSKQPNGGVGDKGALHNPGGYLQDTCKACPHEVLSWKVYVDPTRHETDACPGSRPAHGVSAVVHEAAESTVSYVDEKLNDCSKALTFPASPSGTFLETAFGVNAPSGLIGPVPRLLKLDIGENELLLEQLVDRDVEVQKLLCIEEENLALNDLLIKFTRCLIKTYSKTKLLQIHCTNYQQLQDTVQKMKTDLDHCNESPDMQQAGCLDENNETHVSSNLTYFPVKWNSLKSSVTDHSVEVAIAAYEEDFPAFQQLNFVLNIFEHAIGSPTGLPADDSLSYLIGGDYFQNADMETFPGSMVLYSKFSDSVTEQPSVSSNGTMYEYGRKYLPLDRQLSRRVSPSSVDFAEYRSSCCHECCLFCSSVRESEMWRGLFEKTCVCEGIWFPYVTVQNQAQALTFRCCAAVEEVASINAELSAQIADFHDLLACLGQESAKVNVLSSNLSLLGIDADDLVHGIDSL